MSENAGDDDWHFAGIAADFEDEDVEQALVGDLAIAVYRAQGQFYATQDLCTHEHAYLSDGVVVDCVIECPYPPRPLRHPHRKGTWRARYRAARDLSGKGPRRPHFHPSDQAAGGGDLEFVAERPTRMKTERIPR